MNQCISGSARSGTDSGLLRRGHSAATRLHRRLQDAIQGEKHQISSEIDASNFRKSSLDIDYQIFTKNGTI